MTNVLIIGANGKIARIAERFMIADENVQVTLFLRRAARLDGLKDQVKAMIEGNASNEQELAQAVAGQDVVYANLAGENIVAQAQAVRVAMEQSGVQRLIWISTIGIYDEVPGKFGEWNKNILGDYITNYRAATDQIEQSALDYTIIRPAWLTDKDEVDYELTQKGEDFKGTEVSRKSIAALVYHLVIKQQEHVRESLGVNKPGTDGDKPAWY